MEVALKILIIFIGLCFYFRKWINGKNFSQAHRADGKTFIITGASSSIGRETAIGIAERGGRVIMACRDVNKGEVVRSMIVKQTKNPNVKVMHLDLASFKSIRNFAEKVLNEEPRLDVLINNASVMGMERTVTEDGLEMHMGVNHFGHFLLTLLLVHRLKESAPSRIVTLTNVLSDWVHLNKNDMNSEKSYSRYHAFLQSKQANFLFNKELGNRLMGSGISNCSVHPGFYYANRHNDVRCRKFFDILSKMFLRSTKSGAQSTLRAALDFNLQNVYGAFFNNFELDAMNPDANDPQLKTWLWEYSERVTGIQLPLNMWQLDDYNVNVRRNREASLNRSRS